MKYKIIGLLTLVVFFCQNIWGQTNPLCLPEVDIFSATQSPSRLNQSQNKGQNIISNVEETLVVLSLIEHNDVESGHNLLFELIAPNGTPTIAKELSFQKEHYSFAADSLVSSHMTEIVAQGNLLGYGVAATFKRTENGPTRVIIFRLDTDGCVVWSHERTVSTPNAGNEFARDILLNQQGELVVLIESFENQTVIATLDINGTFVENHEYLNNQSPLRPRAIIETKQSDNTELWYLMVGNTGNQIFTLPLNINFGLLENGVRLIDIDGVPENIDEVVDIEETASGKLIIAGHTFINESAQRGFVFQYNVATNPTDNNLGVISNSGFFRVGPDILQQKVTDLATGANEEIYVSGFNFGDPRQPSSFVNYLNPSLQTNWSKRYNAASTFGQVNGVVPLNQGIAGVGDQWVVAEEPTILIFRTEADGEICDCNFENAFNEGTLTPSLSYRNIQQIRPDWSFVFPDIDCTNTTVPISYCTKTEATGPPVEFKLVDQLIPCDSEAFCIDLKVERFDNINKFQFSLNWDINQFDFQSASFIGTSLNDGQKTMNIDRTTSGELGIQWQAQGALTNGISLPDDSSILSICFTTKGESKENNLFRFEDSPTARLVTFTSQQNGKFSGKDGNIVIDCEKPCEANFSYETPDECGTVLFTDLSAGEIATYQWTFGNGQSSSLPNPSVTYTESGVYNISLTVFDATGCSDVFQETITVSRDQEPPLVFCPPPVTIECYLSVGPETTGFPAVEDNCGNENLNILYLDDIINDNVCSGLRTRTWIVEDLAGNITRCEQLISVIDPDGPIIENCPQDVTLTSIGDNCNAFAQIGTPFPRDLCNDIIRFENDFNRTNDASGFYPVGTTVVTWTAEDVCGNISTCQHTVTVNDIKPPSVACLSDITVTATAGVPGMIVDFDLPQPLDDCGATIVIDRQPGSFFLCGNNPVEYYAVDEAGNRSEPCVFDIFVDCGTTKDCCQEIEAFDRLVDGGFSVSVFGNQVTLNASSLSSCQLVDIDWGDGNTSNNLPGDQLMTYQYTNPMIYEICLTAYTLDDGQRCLENTICQSVCVTNDDCEQKELVATQVKQIGSAPFDEVSAVIKNDQGDIFVAGSYGGRPKDEDFPVFSFGQTDAFIAKYQANTGNLLWLAPIGGNGVDAITDLALDNAGNVIVGGLFSSDSLSLYSAPTSGGNSQYLLNQGENCGMTNGSCLNDGFLAKYSTQGAIQWARSIGGPQNDLLNAITVVGDNAIIATGRFTETVDFDPTPQSFLLIGGIGDAFITKYDEAGNFDWAFDLGQNGSTNLDEGLALTSDNFGHFYVTGYFKGNIDFDPSQEGSFRLTSSNNGAGQDIFIAKYNENQGFSWAYQLGNGGISNAGTSLAVEGNQLYLGGNINNGANFNFDPKDSNADGAISPVTPQDIFLSRYDLSFNFDWVKSFPANGELADIALVQTNESIWMSGQFDNPNMNLDDQGDLLLSTNGNKDIFLIQMSQNGGVMAGQQLGGTLNDFGQSISFDRQGNGVLGGAFFSSTISLPAFPPYEILNTGNQDGFWLQLNERCPPPDECPTICDNTTLNWTKDTLDCCYRLQISNGVLDTWNGFEVSIENGFFSSSNLSNEDWVISQRSAKSLFFTPLTSTIDTGIYTIAKVCPTWDNGIGGEVGWRMSTTEAFLCQDSLILSCTDTLIAPMLMANLDTIYCADNEIEMVYKWKTSIPYAVDSMYWEWSMSANENLPQIAGATQSDTDTSGTVTFRLSSLPSLETYCGYIGLQDQTNEVTLSTDSICLEIPDCYEPLCSPTAWSIQSKDDCQFDFFIQTDCSAAVGKTLSIELPIPVFFRKINVATPWAFNWLDELQQTILLTISPDQVETCAVQAPILSFELDEAATSILSDLKVQWLENESLLCEDNIAINCNPGIAEDPISITSSGWFCIDDQSGILNMELTNNGNSPINQVHISFMNNQAMPLDGGNSITIPISLAPGESAQITPVEVVKMEDTDQFQILIEGYQVDGAGITQYCRGLTNTISAPCDDCVCRQKLEVNVTQPGGITANIDCGATLTLEDCQFDFCLLSNTFCNMDDCNAVASFQIVDVASGVLVSSGQFSGNQIDTCFDFSPGQTNELLGPGLFEFLITPICEANNCNNCQFFINIPCTEACQPEINCPEDILLTCPGFMELPAPTFDDNCGNKSFSCFRDDNLPLNSRFTNDTTTITCIVTTEIGFRDSCSYRVIIENTEPLTLDCPSNITITTEPGATGTTVEFQEALTNHECYESLNYSIASGSFFDCGATTVTATLIDSIRQDTLSCSFDVTVTCPTIDTCSLVSVIYNPDDNISDNCCYQLSIPNNFEGDQFSGIQITVGGNDRFDSWAPIEGWTVNETQSNSTSILLEPNSGFIPVGMNTNVIRLCNSFFTPTNSQIQVAWLTQDGMAPICPSFISVDCPTTTCCVGEAAFLERAQNVSLNPSTDDCVITLEVDGLGKCDQIYFDWNEDGIRDEGPFTNGMTITHIYDAGGRFQPCFEIVEVDFNNGNCYTPYQGCVAATVECVDFCCKSEENFRQRVQQGFTFNFQNCLLSVTPNDLNECDQVTWKWGDGQTTASGNQQTQHLFGDSGTYEVCMEVTEQNEDNNCWPSEQFCQTFELSCDPTCNCGLFSDISLGQTPNSFQCGQLDQILPCTEQGTDFNLSGKFACQGNCTTENIRITILRNQVLVTEYDVSLAGGQFSTTLSDAFFQQPGEYTITLAGNCGTLDCNCQIGFIIPAECDCYCPTDPRFLLTLDEQMLAIGCGEIPMDLGCRSGNFTLEGTYGCLGNACQEELIRWTITDPLGATFSNIVPGGDFRLNFGSAILKERGRYQLDLSFSCGINDCSCTIIWDQGECEACFCPATDLLWTNSLNCNQVDFTFKSENSACDSIRIDFGDGTYQVIQTSDTTIQHTYPGTGSFEVCYLVKRMDSNGETCTFSDCRTIAIDCQFGAGASENILLDGGFESPEGIWQWPDNGSQFTLTQDQGCMDPNYLNIQIPMNERVQAGPIAQGNLSIIQNTPYEVSWCLSSDWVYHATDLKHSPYIVLVASQSPITSPDISDCNGPCEMIRLPLGLQSADTWTTIHSSTWTPSENYAYLQLFVVTDHPLPIPINVQLDQVTIQTLATDLENTLLTDQVVNLYPNPTNDLLNIQFTNADFLSRGSIHIRNAFGTIMSELKLENGQLNYTMDLSSLPAGLLWVELRHETRGLIWVKKVVHVR